MALNQDDVALQAIYGKAYGAADKSRVADGIQHESRADEFPLDRSTEMAATVAPVFPDLSDSVEPDIVADLVDGGPKDAWAASVEAFARSQSDPFSTDDVLIHGMHFMPDFLERADQMRVAAVLKSLGYSKQQRRVSGERQNLWIPPSTPTPGASHD